MHFQFQYLNMAAMSFGHIKTMRSFCRVFFIVIFFFCSFCLHDGGCQLERPTKTDVEAWAVTIDKKLVDINDIADIVEKSYETVKMRYEDINELDLVKKMSETLSQILRKKMEALKKSVEAAERIARDSPKNPDIEISDIDYYNSKTSILSETKHMEYSDRFGKAVNFNFSSVHIPVEIYEGSNDILNGLNWTTGLDEQFRKNYEADPDILWQYFGSQSGFMRTYPATNWKKNGVDLYDVRRQSWYTQGSSSPKDMLILIDTSGSTYGQSLQLMKNAVKSILNTLGENDFVNVVEFSETAKFVSKCFNHTAFVQANFRNKKQLEKDVDKLEALGQADFSVAIKFAFEKFKEFARNESNDENNIGANCNKVIMLLTDGGTDNAEDVFQEYNWPNKTVRVFTYAVGPTPNPIHAIRWMACANRGYFSQIPAMGAIRSRVQDYVRVLERPLAIAHADHSLWTSSHRSIYYSSNQWTAYTEHLKKTLESYQARHYYWELTHDPRGLGMMTTVTLPVYNHTSESSNQTILGVMGVDVTTAQLEAHTPFSKIGPNGYAFAINPNGYVVFHPNLKTLGKFMNEPPNIDLLELEVDGDTPALVKLRTEMIKGEENEMVLDSHHLSPCQRYVSYGQATYAYIPIKNTTFRLGISVPTYQKKYPKLSWKIGEMKWPDENEDFSILIAPWAYHNVEDRNKDMGAYLSDLTDVFSKDKELKNWNEELLFHLYYDVILIAKNQGVINFIKTIIKESNDTDINDTESPKAVFIMTNGGMTLVSPKSEADYFKKMRDLRKSSLYTRTLYARGCLFMADHIIAKRSNKSSEPFINVARPVTVSTEIHKQDHVSDKPAIAGLRVSHDKFMKVVHESIKDKTREITLNRQRAGDIDFDGLLTCEDYALVCYLIDDGGFLVASSRDDAREQVGRFFGLVDPPVMHAMNGTVYGRMVQYDFQAACKIEEDTFSAGFRSFTIPSFNLLSEFLTTSFWTSKVTWAFSSFNIFSWVFSPSVEVMAENKEDDEKECVKSIQQYYFINDTIPGGIKTQQDDVEAHQGGIQCDNCTRNFYAIRLISTNLLFVVVDPACEECDESYPPVGQAPREITAHEEEDIICQLAQNPRKRVQLYGCYHSDLNEDQSECGGGCLHPSWMSVYIVVITVMFKWIPSVL